MFQMLGDYSKAIRLIFPNMKPDSETPILLCGNFNMGIMHNKSIVNFIKYKFNFDCISSASTTVGNTCVDLTFTRNNVNKKVQLDATACRHLFTAKSLYMFRVSQHPSSGALKTVTATSGIGHNTGTVTSFQRGLIWTFTLEGSSYTSVMTYTRGSGYSF